MTTICSIKNLSYAIDGNVILNNFSMEIEKNDFIEIRGSNGSGKSTLLKIFCKLIPSKACEYKDNLKEHIDYLGHKNSLVEELSIRRNFELEDLALDSDIAKNFEIKELYDELCANLSFGEKRKFAIAKLLQAKKKIWVLDEPFAGVDAATETAIMAVLKALQSDGKTVIAVHHDLSTVSAYFDHLFLLNRRAVASGSVAEVFNKDNLVTAYGGKLGAAQLDAIGL